jgi:hypothetical protein
MRDVGKQTREKHTEGKGEEMEGKRQRGET